MQYGGRDCGITDAGHHAMVSMWFNGSKLVQFETRGSEVIKYRLSATGANTMEVEVIPLPSKTLSQALGKGVGGGSR
jgi:hypothetical protein